LHSSAGVSAGLPAVLGPNCVFSDCDFSFASSGLRCDFLPATRLAPWAVIFRRFRGLGLGDSLRLGYVVIRSEPVPG
jgi:hypothetical protein